MRAWIGAEAGGPAQGQALGLREWITPPNQGLGARIWRACCTRSEQGLGQASGEVRAQRVMQGGSHGKRRRTGQTDPCLALGQGEDRLRAERAD